MYRIVFIIVTILAIALGLLAGTLNSEPVELDLLWVSLNWPLGLLILSALASGVLLGVFLSWFFAILPLRLRQRRQADSNGNGSRALKSGHG